MKEEEINRPTKFDTSDYDYECFNCDDVFRVGEEKELAHHQRLHKKALGKDIETGFWRKWRS